MSMSSRAQRSIAFGDQTKWKECRCLKLIPLQSRGALDFEMGGGVWREKGVLTAEHTRIVLSGECPPIQYDVKTTYPSLANETFITL